MEEPKGVIVEQDISIGGDQFKRLSKDLNNDEANKVNNSNLECPLCSNKSFSSILHHMETCHANDIEQFQCPLCPHTSKNRCYIRKHLNNCHSQKYQYKCQYCSANFKMKHSLSAHMFNLHKDNFSKSYGRDDVGLDLKKIKTVTLDGVKMYRCYLCEKMFNVIYKVVLHFNGVHKNKFECVICEEKVTTVTKLRKHLKLEHQLKCVSNKNEVLLNSMLFSKEALIQKITDMKNNKNKCLTDLIDLEEIFKEMLSPPENDAKQHETIRIFASEERNAPAFFKNTENDATILSVDNISISSLVVNNEDKTSPSKLVNEVSAMPKLMTDNEQLENEDDTIDNILKLLKQQKNNKNTSTSSEISDDISDLGIPDDLSLDEIIDNDEEILKEKSDYKPESAPKLLHSVSESERFDIKHLGEQIPEFVLTSNLNSSKQSTLLNGECSVDESSYTNFTENNLNNHMPNVNVPFEAVGEQFEMNKFYLNNLSYVSVENNFELFTPFKHKMERNEIIAKLPNIDSIENTPLIQETTVLNKVELNGDFFDFDKNLPGTFIVSSTPCYNNEMLNEFSFDFGKETAIMGENREHAYAARENSKFSKCPRCSKYILSKQLKYHILKVHEKLISYLCAYCDHKSAYKSNIAIHMKNKHNIDYTPDRNNELDCEQCGRHFKKKNYLKKHKASIHKTDEERYHDLILCEVCKKVFKNSSTAIRHMKEVHNNKNEYECDICGSKYKTKRTIIKHIKECQANLKMRRCRACKKDVLITEYTQHFESHRICFMCDYKSMRYSNIQRHLKTVHNLTFSTGSNNAQEHVCNICKKKFKESSSLKTHIKEVHLTAGRNFNCIICTSSFKNQKSLRAHSKSCQPKVNICKYCNVSFDNSVSLHRHLVICKPEDLFVPII